MLPPAVGVLPIVRPNKVTVTATLETRVVPAVVITMEVEFGVPMGVRLQPAVDTEPVGVALEAKNPEGKFSVMVLAATRAPPVNENVTVTLVLPTTRSTLARETEFRVAEPPIPPDATAFEGIISELVASLTSLPNVGVLPIVKPCKVIETATLAASCAPAVVITMELEVGAPMGVSLLPATDAEPVGAELEEKNPEG